MSRSDASDSSLFPPPGGDSGTAPAADRTVTLPARRKPLGPGFDPASQPWEANPTGLRAVPPDRLTAMALRARFARPPAWTPESAETWSTRFPGPETGLRLASVLVPLVMRASGLQVMLTQRTAHLHDHAGQVSFPGGRVEKSDASVIAAALREAQEETGLPPEKVEVIGQLPDYVTSTGYNIVPLVGLVQPDFDPEPNPFEVAEVFEVPLTFLMDPANHRVHRVALPHNGSHTYFSMPYGKYFVWGATAGMLHNLYRFLDA